MAATNIMIMNIPVFEVKHTGTLSSIPFITVLELNHARARVPSMMKETPTTNIRAKLYIPLKSPYTTFLPSPKLWSSS